MFGVRSFGRRWVGDIRVFTSAVWHRWQFKPTQRTSGDVSRGRGAFPLHKSRALRAWAMKSCTGPICNLSKALFMLEWLAGYGFAKSTAHTGSGDGSWGRTVTFDFEKPVVVLPVVLHLNEPRRRPFQNGNLYATVFLNFYSIDSIYN